MTRDQSPRGSRSGGAVRAQSRSRPQQSPWALGSHSGAGMSPGQARNPLVEDPTQREQATCSNSALKAVAEGAIHSWLPLLVSGRRTGGTTQRNTSLKPCILITQIQS